MIVEYAPGTGARLAEPLDFHKFKLVLKGELEIGSSAPNGIKLVDKDNALIPIELVPALPGRPEGGDWELGYAKMIATACKLGWIDAETNAIRAHIERHF